MRYQFHDAVIGLASFAGPPLGGKFIDKFGPKPVLMVGLALSSLGYVLMAFLVSPLPSVPPMVFGLAIVGVGLGFSMGAPVNYMILENTAPEDSNSAISTVTLVRQVALSLAPALYVAFITTGQGAIGYQPMFIAVAVACALPLLLMFGYPSPRKSQTQGYRQTQTQTRLPLYRFLAISMQLVHAFAR